MPKSKKASKPGEESQTAWRTPVKLPAAIEPMKSLYLQESSNGETKLQPELSAVAAPPISARTKAKPKISTQESSNSRIENVTVNPKNQFLNDTDQQNINVETTSENKNSEAGKTQIRLAEPEFLRLLKTEKMDFYSLAEILRGSSMALYCILYSESLAKGEIRCQIRQSELMMRAGINNPATLYKQERWLTVLGLIKKSVRLGNHSGASYEVRPLETLPLPTLILEQFDGYLSELFQ